MLTKIGLENFKAFGSYTELDIGDLTVYAGLNSSGKTSIYQALQVLIQSHGKYYTDQFNNILPFLVINGNLVKLGKNKEILHNPKLTYVKFVLVWDNSIELCYKYSLNLSDNSIGSTSDKGNVFFLSETHIKKDGEIQIQVSAKRTKWRVEAHDSLRFVEFDIAKIIYDIISEDGDICSDKDISIDEDELTSDEKLTLETLFCPNVIFENVQKVNLSYNLVNRFEIGFAEVKQSLEPNFRDEVNWKKVKKAFNGNNINPDQVTLVNANIAQYLKYELTENNILVLPPFRGYPQRLYTDTTEPNPLSLFINESQQIVPYYYDSDKDIIREGSLEEAFNFWIVDHFEIADKVIVEEPISGLATEIYLQKNKKKLPIINVGFGISQILPVIFLLLEQDNDKIMIVDEPEIHLHPSVQSKLADFFFSMAVTGRKLIIETHSEYLIDKLIYLSIKNENKKDSFKLMWLKRINHESKAEEIEFDEFGYLINPPDGF